MTKNNLIALGEAERPESVGVSSVPCRNIKLTLLTACYNSEKTIGATLASVARQKGVQVEYLIMDGGSTDSTLPIVAKFAAEARVKCPWLEVRVESGRDKGMYDALNKGIARATGEVVGILNADDALADEDTLAAIGRAFEAGVDAVYGDIRFVRELGGKTVRYCSARQFRPWMFRFAVMVPHPSFYCRRELFAKYGGYSLDYRICADFELILRFMWKYRIRTCYLPRCVVEMRLGGVSTAGFKSNIEINREDLRALRANGCWSSLGLIYLKYLFKVWGLLRRG